MVKFTGGNLVIHTGTDEHGHVDSVWAECPESLSDADVEASVKLTAAQGCENAQRALKAMKGETFVNILWPREPTCRVYRDGEL